MGKGRELKLEIRDERLLDAIDPDCRLFEIGDDFKFTEGPVWLERSRCFLFSDIHGDTIYRWSSGEGLNIWRRPSRNANGNTADGSGRLVTCEHGSRQVTRTEEDGSLTILAEEFEGKLLNSPNDVVVKSDGSIWFTDPPYGIKQEMQEQPANYVFRLDPANSPDGENRPDSEGRVIVPVADDFSRPNGLCFTPDEKKLFIADSDREIHHIRLFRVRTDNFLEEEGLFAVIAPGIPDGMRVDSKGRLFTTAGDGIQIFDPEGRLLGKILLPQSPTNCAFGGPGLRTLLVTAREYAFSVSVKVSGAKVPGTRAPG